MTLEKLKKSTYSLIEELTTDTEFTADEDLAAKFNDSCNRIIYELARIKKILAFEEISFIKDITYDLKTLTNFYQIKKLDLEYEIIDTLIIPNETKTTKLYYYIMPEKIDDTTADTHIFELDDDVMEIAAYGLASDMLKADVSVNYQVYANRYTELKNSIDTRYNSGTMSYVDLDMGVI